LAPLTRKGKEMRKLRIVDYPTSMLSKYYVVEIRNLSSLFMWLPIFFGKAEDINKFMEESKVKEIVEARAKKR
jgi:hypothetical protein